MTCVIGLIEKGIIYMGADSLSLSDYDIASEQQAKVFIKKIPNLNKKLIMGCAGEVKIRQLLQYQWKIPATNNITDEWLNTEFIASIADITLRTTATATIMFGIDEKLYLICSMLSVIKKDTNFCAIGCGSPYALGAMECLSKLSARKRILKSLEIAEKYTVAVRKPFTILSI